jgi:hypothetical protein
MQDKEKVFKFQGWSNMIYCLPSDLIPKKKIDLLYELLQSQSAWNKSLYKILNENSSKKIIYLGFLKGSVKDFDGFAKKNLRGVYEIEGENSVRVGYGNGNFKTTFLPMYLKVYDHEQGLEKYTSATIIIHYMMQPCLDRYDVSMLAYGQSHSGKTNVMEKVSYDLFLNVSCCERVLHLVYDRVKPWKVLCDASSHKLDAKARSLRIYMQWLFFGLVSQTQVYQHHRRCNGKIENDMWSSKILVQLVPNFNSVSKLVASWFLSKLMSLPNAMRSTIEVYRKMIFIYYGLLNFVFDRGKFLMDANFNLEDKVVSKEVGIDRNVDRG